MLSSASKATGLTVELIEAELKMKTKYNHLKTKPLQSNVGKFFIQNKTQQI